MHRVIVLVDYFVAAKFFLRIAKCDPEREYFFICNSFSSHSLVKKNGFPSKLVSRLSAGKKIGLDSEISEDDFKKTREYVLDLIGEKQAAYFYAKILSAAEGFLSQDKDNIIVTWNGSNVIGQAMRFLKRANPNVSTLFLELANVKGKIFADPDGVNAESSLYFSPEILDDGVFSPQEYEDLKNNFRKEKMGNAVIPPQVVSAKRIQFYKVLDYFYFRFFGYCSVANLSIFKRIKYSFSNGLDPRLEEFNQKTGEMLEGRDGSSLFGEGFIFFPMQVSTDTQLILNSDVDNYQAIRILAETQSLPVVIKPHPYECESEKILKVISDYRGRVFFSNENTYKLIDQAKKVATINSTVGMEAMLMGKDVEFLGRTFFSNFDQNRLASYLLCHLVDIDFFDDDAPVSHLSVNKMYSFSS